MDIDLDNAVKLFKGECYGVILTRRGKDDPHVCFGFIVEDDENWFPHKGTGSTYWLSDIKQQLKEAEDWMEANCRKDEWGYYFR